MLLFLFFLLLLRLLLLLLLLFPHGLCINLATNNSGFVVAVVFVVVAVATAGLQMLSFLG